MITEPGVYDMSAEEYYTDPCPTPSLSASLTKVLDNESPQHAWLAHPRLNAEVQHSNKSAFNLGSAAHAVILGSDDQLVVINPIDYLSKTGTIPAGWTNDAIRAARDAVYAAGNTPLLPEQFAEVTAMAIAVFAATGNNIELKNWQTKGKPERVLAWRENGIWLRARLDWMPDDPMDYYIDLKTTATSVNPEVIGRYAMSLGWDIQEAFYRRGLRALGICDYPKFRFIAVESAPPYATVIISLPADVQSYANQKVEQAITLFKRCLDGNSWPGYTHDTVLLEPPAFTFARHNQRWQKQRATKAEQS